MRTTRIFTKIFLSNAIVGLFSVITISIIFYFLIRDALIERTLDQLESVNSLKAARVDDYFREKGNAVDDKDISKIQPILLENTGMGSTGESYIVGPDNRLRSKSRFFPDRSPETIEVREQNTDRDHIRIDYRGKKVLSFSKDLQSSSLKWRIVSEIDFSEAMDPVVRFRNYLVIITIICAIVIVGVSVFLSNMISLPILYLQRVIMRLARGILPTSATSVKNTDEIGQIARAVDQLVAGLRRTTDFAYQIGQGNFEAQYTSLSEQDTLGLAIIDMRDQLKQFNEREIKLVRDKTAALIEGQENERKRITRELHDGVGQLLTAIRLRMEAIPIEAMQRKEITDLINETITEVKRISYNLMPGSLVDFGLEAALKDMCDNTARYSSLQFDFRYVHESNQALNFDVTVAVFRIVQEGINNVIKHASASKVELHVLAREDEVYVLLKDNGTGFDMAARNNSGLGLRSMAERAKLLNGSVDIHSRPGESTIVEARIPLHKQLTS